MTDESKSDRLSISLREYMERLFTEHSAQHELMDRANRAQTATFVTRDMHDQLIARVDRDITDLRSSRDQSRGERAASLVVATLAGGVITGLILRALGA